MRTPGFTADTSLYASSGQYYGTRASGQSGPALQPASPITSISIWNICARFPWLCQPSPSIKVTYQPPYGHGFPGTLFITGKNFAPDTDVSLTIDNCDAFRLRTTVHTSVLRQACLAVPPYTCFTIPGGSFTTTVPCYCGGTGTVLCPGPVACVEAQDPVGDTAQGSTAINC